MVYNRAKPKTWQTLTAMSLKARKGMIQTNFALKLFTCGHQMYAINVLCALKYICLDYGSGTMGYSYTQCQALDIRLSTKE